METVGNGMTLIKMLLIVGYLSVIILSVMIFSRAESGISSRQALYHHIIFGSITLVLSVVLVSKLLHLSGKFADIGRMWAKSGDWYEARRVVQLLIVSAVGISGVVSAALMERVLYGIWRRYRPALFGILFLISFLIINAISYHPIDRVLSQALGGIKFFRIIELLSLMWIAVSLLMTWCRASNSPKITKDISATRFL